jgi:hypothetical protein
MKINIHMRIIVGLVLLTVLLAPYSASAENDITVVGEYDAQEGELLDVNVKEEIAYVLTKRIGNFELRSLDVSRPAKITQMDTIPLLGKDMRNVLIKEDIAYIGSLYGFYIVDISDPSFMKLIWDYCTAEHLNGLEFQIRNDHVFIITFNGYIEIADISDPGKPSLTSRVIIPDREYRAIHIDGQYAYATYVDKETTGVSVFDINEPASPHLIDTLELPVDETLSLYAGNGLIYVVGIDHDEVLGGAHNNMILTVDATNPDDLNLISNTLVSRSENAVSSKSGSSIVHRSWIIDGHIFLMETNGSLKILDDEPSNPTLIREFNGISNDGGVENPPTTNSFFIEESRSLAYVVTDETLYLLDISNYVKGESFLSRYWWIPVTIVITGVIVITLRMTRDFLTNAKSRD